MVKGSIKARDPYEKPAVEKARKRLLEEFTGFFFKPEWGVIIKLETPTEKQK
jgi:hypothetical protein